MDSSKSQTRIFSTTATATTTTTTTTTSSSSSSSSNPGFIPPHRTQLHPRMHTFSSSSLPPPPPPSSSSSFSSKTSSASPHSHLKWWSLTAALFVVPLLLYLLLVARRIHRSNRFTESKPTGFGLVLHASPDSTRILVFEFLNQGSRVPFVARHSPSASAKARPGLARIGPNGSAEVVSGLLRFAMQHVPRLHWKRTRVSLLATGGLGPASDAILDSCRRVLRSSTFLFRDHWVSIISGEEQGLYSWVAANYALGTLGSNPEETTGIIELGGASAQVTFTPREPPPIEFSRMVKVAGMRYHLYSQSILHLGQDGAWESLLELHKSTVLTSSSGSVEGAVMDPCIPKGFNQTASVAEAFYGSESQLPAVNSVGNFSACRSVVFSLLHKRHDKCFHSPCTKVASLMPKLQGKPMDARNFFYTSELFGLVPRVSLREVEAVGQHFCEGGWVQLKDEYHGIDETDLLRYCFSSAFMVSILHDQLGVPMDDNRVGFANKVDSVPLDWTLGAFIKQTVDDIEQGTDNVASIVGDDTVTYLSLVAILLLMILAAFIISKLRKPKLKTVYDLEKGRYIVTRISR